MSYVYGIKHNHKNTIVKIVVNYAVQGANNHRYNSEILDLSLVPPLYSPRPHKADIEKEIIKWAKEQKNKTV
jgi:hypothetical protein